MNESTPEMLSQNQDATEYLETDLTEWEIGPYHSALPGPLRLRLTLDGEVIVASEYERGFAHRGLEKAIELHPWSSAIVYADRLDPEQAVFGELAVCLAVEQVAGLEVTKRGERIRLILCELTRVSAHLGFIARVARSVGAETMLHYVLRDRERVLDLFELLTGSRFSIGFLRYGGVSADVTDGFIERVIEVCDLLWVRMKEYNDLFTFNHAFLKRTSGVAVLSAEQIARFGVTGPNARAGTTAPDVRKQFPYCGYGEVDFDVPLGKGESGMLGDAHDRFLIRLREMTQCFEILKQAVDSVPSGAFVSLKADFRFEVPKGEAYSRVESARGLLGCHVVSEGGAKPSRVQFRVPSIAHLESLNELLCGYRIEDVPLIVSSLDIGVAEADR